MIFFTIWLYTQLKTHYRPRHKHDRQWYITYLIHNTKPLQRTTGSDSTMIYNLSVIPSELAIIHCRRIYKALATWLYFLVCYVLLIFSSPWLLLNYYTVKSYIVLLYSLIIIFDSIIFFCVYVIRELLYISFILIISDHDSRQRYYIIILHQSENGNRNAHKTHRKPYKTSI